MSLPRAVELKAQIAGFDRDKRCLYFKYSNCFYFTWDKLQLWMTSASYALRKQSQRSVYVRNKYLVKRCDVVIIIYVGGSIDVSFFKCKFQFQIGDRLRGNYRSLRQLNLTSLMIRTDSDYDKRFIKYRISNISEQLAR